MNTETVTRVVIDTPFGIWEIQVRGHQKAEEAAVNFVLKRDGRLSLKDLKVR